MKVFVSTDMNIFEFIRRVKDELFELAKSGVSRVALIFVNEDDSYRVGIGFNIIPPEVKSSESRLNMSEEVRAFLREHKDDFKQLTIFWDK